MRQPELGQRSATDAPRARRDITLLGFVAAFVDTCGFIGLFGVFTAHVTGNFVLIGAALVYGHGDLLAKLLVLPMFMVAVAATYFASVWCERRRAPLVGPGLLCEAVLLLATIATAWSGGGLKDAATPLSLVAALLLAAAMGLQNGLNRLAYPRLPPTTVMTGNVTQIVIDLMTLAFAGRDAPGAARRAESVQRVRHLLPLIIAFTLGAAGGAAGFAWLGFGCLILPALACLFLAIDALVRRV